MTIYYSHSSQRRDVFKTNRQVRVTTEVKQRRIYRIWVWMKAHRTALTAVLFWLVMIAGVRYYLVENDLAFAELATQLQTILSTSWYGPVLYILVYTVRPLVLFPAWLLTILGGNVFGLWAGFAYALLGGTASSALPYILGRWFSSSRTDEISRETSFQKFTKTLRQNPFQTILIMRLLYLPYDAVNILAGSLRIPFFAFLGATALGNLGGTLSFVGVGASVEGNLFNSGISLNPDALVVSVGILVLSLGFSRLLNRYQKRQTVIFKQEGSHE